MVLDECQGENPSGIFQYSLCRVVLMVNALILNYRNPLTLSVLALSSRFDGLIRQASMCAYDSPFSTRSVESF